MKCKRIYSDSEGDSLVLSSVVCLYSIDRCRIACVEFIALAPQALILSLVAQAKRRGGAESRRSQVRASPDGSESSSSQHSHSTPEPPPKPQPVSKPMWKAPFSLKAAHAESVKLLHDGKLETMVTACMRSRHRQLRLVAVKVCPLWMRRCIFCETF